jgi:hypothetical protein
MTEIPVTIGASASCTDGVGGRVIRVVMNPVGLAVTHLVIGPEHAHGIIFVGSFRWTSPRLQQTGSV